MTSNQGENIIHEYTHIWSSQVVKNPSANSGAAGTAGLITVSERSLGKGKSYPLQYFDLENPMDCVVHGVAKPLTGLRDFHFHIYVCVYELSHFSSVKLFATPWTVACQAPLSMGLSWLDYSSGLPFPFPGNLSDSAIKPAFQQLLNWKMEYYT